MHVLEHLEPADVFRFFEEISSIPRPSHHEKAISDYLVRFAKERGLEYYQDGLYNVIIIKEASEGYEDQEPLILQGHMDMVCEKKPGCGKDMEKEGLDLVIDGDYIRAEGTTLGGDDGIAVACALALLDDETLKHPRLEFVCTVCEEVGMDGAHALDCSPLKGRLLLNIDSEVEGIVTAGCAGGARINISLPVEREKDWGNLYFLEITGLLGGHSGVEIDKQRMNATVLAGRILRALYEKGDASLFTLTGGTKDNAIPSRTTALLLVREEDAAAAAVKQIEAEVRKELAVTDPGLKIRFSPADAQDARNLVPLKKESAYQVISLLTALPNGVVRMSDSIPGMVQTSLNLGCASLEQNSLNLGLSLRSSVASELHELADRVIWTAGALGASAELSGEYPAWEYVRESSLRDRMAVIFREIYGKEMKVETIHAGLECGLLSEKIKDLDAVSIGPDILDIHTPEERLSIASVQRTYDFIRRIVEAKA